MKFPSFFKKKDPTVITRPHSAQQSIPIRRIHKDGIWEVGTLYSRTWRFTDINFSVADDKDKEDMLEIYVELEKALPTDAFTKITIVNKGIDTKKFQREMLLPSKNDGNDHFRSEYNRMMMDKAAEGNNIMQERYITVSVQRKNIEEARTFFRRVASDLAGHLRNLSSRLYDLDNEERLTILHDLFRIGEEGRFSFDFDKTFKRGQDFKDNICPDSIQFNSNHFALGDAKVGRVLFLKDYPSYLRDRFVKELTDLPRNMMLSIDIQPIPTAVSMRYMQNKSLAVETDIARHQQRQNANNNFSAVLPPYLIEKRESMSEILEELTTNDQRMTNVVMTLVHMADDETSLNSDTESLQSIASSFNCNLATLTYQQEDGLNTVLPYGLRKVDVLRTLTTNSAAALVPFASQEIYHPHGIYYGNNPQTRNLIVCDRRQLKNANGFILGVSGSGKSFAAKLEIEAIILATDDDVIIIDPEREYKPLIDVLGGQCVEISAGSHNHINAMDMSKGYGEDENRPDSSIILKTQFMMSLCEEMMEYEHLGASEKSIVGRCVERTYKSYVKNPQSEPPTLKDFREELLRQKEPEAQAIALALERFTIGTMDVFAHQTNVNMENRIMLYDIFDLDSQLKPVGMLVMLDAILNRVIENHKRGRRTWIYIDEIYLFFANEYSANFLEQCWKRFRKKGAAATGITQNVSDCLRSPTAKNMLANSEFMLMLSQAPTDQDELVNMLHISKEQLKFIDNAPEGHGLLKVGGCLAPIVNKFPKDTDLYRYMNTKPED